MILVIRKKISVLQKPKTVREVLFESAIVEKYIHKAEFGKKNKKGIDHPEGAQKIKEIGQSKDPPVLSAVIDQT